MSNQIILKKFGRNVRAKRIEQGLSQERLGELSKLHRTYIGMIERGEKNITLTNVAKITKAIKAKTSDLLDF